MAAEKSSRVISELSEWELADETFHRETRESCRVRVSTNGIVSS